MADSRRAPPWWPEGESWPPRGPGGRAWHWAPRRFRRRFLVALIILVIGLLGTGFVIGLVLDGPGPGGPPGGPRGKGGPWFLFPVIALVFVVGAMATARAYRRISGPLGRLLGAAQRVSGGQYDVSVAPAGPRELRSLITSFNDMAARLRAAEDQRRRFLADVTHELRTPVTVLQSRIEAQLDGIHPRDDGHLSLLLEETKLLGRLIDDLHTLALADAGRLVLHYERTHPRVLVEEAVTRHGPAAERAGVAITTVVADGLPDVDVDPTRILQVLGNLISNAVRHSPTGGTVTVEADTETSDRVAFTVTDEGPGFQQEQLPHLFARPAWPERRDSFSGLTQPRGSGLGLSIARDLVVAHGGTIEAGRGPEGGARVAFAVPVTRPAA